jgi:hypothetical protein
MGWPVFAKEKANEVENGRKVSLLLFIWTLPACY